LLIKRDYQTVQCQNCQYYYVYPLIDFTENDWELLYDEEYFENQTKWHLKKRQTDRVNRLNKLQKMSANPIINFLDVGCGEGFMLLEAEQRGWNVYGLDISDNRTGEAKELRNFKKCELLKSQYPDNFFDCIYLDSILEHVTNPREYLKEINRILKCSGVIYIGVPNEDSLYNTLRKVNNFVFAKGKYSNKIKPFVTPYHVGGFNRYSIKLLLNSQNFTIRKMYNFANRLVFIQARFPSKQFFFYLGLSFIAMFAFILRRENYLGIYAEKITKK